MKNLLFSLFLLVLPLVGFSQNANKNLPTAASFGQMASEGLPTATPSSVGISTDHLAKIDGFIQSYVDKKFNPGGTFLIAKEGKVVYQKSFGHQTPDKKTPYQNKDIYRLASMTKVVTSVAIMQLYEQGKLGLDDPIFYYIPAFAKPLVLENFNKKDSTHTSTPAKNAITIRHLLTHTSGIGYDFNGGELKAIYTKGGLVNVGLSHPTWTTEDLANKIATVPLAYEPGEKWMYGLNMEVLGRIVEVVSGMTLSQYFQKNIFAPLGIKETHFYLPKNIHSRLVPTYTYNKERQLISYPDPAIEYPRSPDHPHYAGGGGLSGTAMDYAVFIQALVNGGEYNGKRILAPKTVALIATDQLIQQNEKGKGFSQKPGRTFGLGFSLTTEEGEGLGPKSAGTYEWGGAFNTKFFIDPIEQLTFVGMTQIIPDVHPEFWERLYAMIYAAIEE